MKRSLTLLLLIIASWVKGEIDPHEALQGVVVDLREPTFVDGVLSTDQGGVVRAPDLRVQARKIRYTRRVVEGEPIFHIEAEGDLMLEYKGRIFVGNELVYDFHLQTGSLTGARTGVGVWYLSGEKVEFLPDGSFKVTEASVTTCDNIKDDWKISSNEVTVSPDNELSARNVKFLFIDFPLFWMPVYSADLERIGDNPIRYRVGFDGHQGVRVGARYRVLSWKDWDSYLRLDYLTRRGLGGGVEVNYRPKDRSAEVRSRNYIAKDFNIFIPEQTTRYRVEGRGYIDEVLDHYQITFQWDKLSDRDMASDYYDRDFNRRSAELTQFTVRREDRDWIGNLLTRVRLNTFQTVRQEIPRLTLDLRPIELGQSGIVTENRAEAGYLNYAFDKGIPALTGFDSTRVLVESKAFRPVQVSKVVLTPEVGFVGVHYSNSPQSKSRAQRVFTAQLDANTVLRRESDHRTHQIKPYCQYRYFSSPSAAPSEVHIFDLGDGWTEVNLATIGGEYTLFDRKGAEIPERLVILNTWTNAFIGTSKTSNPLPRVYSRVTWNQNPSVTHYAQTAWDTARHQLDHFNWRTEWTVNQDLAIASEYRHRSAYSWRKADYNNFIVDFFRSEAELKASPLSDGRDTVLLHAFYRINPTTSIELESRHGWRKSDSPDYHEIFAELKTLVGCNWEVSVAFEHEDADDSLSFNVQLVSAMPNQRNLYRTAWYR